MRLVTFILLFAFAGGCAWAEEPKTPAPLPQIQSKPVKDEDLPPPSSPLSGGETTVFNSSVEAFAKPAPNLPITKLRDFAFGNKLFNTNWVIAPASVKTLDGLGPLFNRVSCSACHFKDGRGQPPANENEPMLTMLMRLSVPGESEHGGPKPHPVYGDQLEPLGIPGVPGEGSVSVRYEEVEGEYADKTRYTLRSPIYEFKKMNYGPLGQDILVSPRVSPAVIGIGLLEAVPEDTIISRADPEDQDEDGISGKANQVWDIAKDKVALGRFGWKANQPGVAQQDAGALSGDIGITSPLLPHQNCSDKQTECKAARQGGQPEISQAFFDKLVFYSRTLAVPARRNVDDPDVRRGEKLFHDSGCASCHLPTLQTGESDIPALANQQIHPFTDLLLHDMGDGLADGRPDFLASGSEWRTAPLWGIGLIKTVNGHTTFLHDGRARDLTEAILWHGGEAEKARDAFRTLNKNERAQLIKFLESL